MLSLSKSLPPEVNRHDAFNLVAILLLILLTLAFLTLQSGFYVLLASTYAYFLFDSAWVYTEPSCVKEPRAILMHHAVTAVFCLIPWIHPRYQTSMAINLLVEINTWLLVAKRHFKSKILEAFFYLTWIIMRLIMYPYLVVFYLNAYLSHAEELETSVTIVAFAPLLQAYLTTLNFFWTFKMLQQKMVKKTNTRPDLVVDLVDTRMHTKCT